MNARYSFGKTVALPPCNVVVRQEEGEGGAVRVEAMDPNAVLTLVDRPDGSELAAEARGLLVRALGKL
jgi:hypothetical protein